MRQRWTRESCTLLYDGKPAIDVTRVVDENSRATLTPVEVDAIRAHICDVLNTLDVDNLKREWMMEKH